MPLYYSIFHIAVAETTWLVVYREQHKYRDNQSCPELPPLVADDSDATTPDDDQDPQLMPSRATDPQQKTSRDTGVVDLPQANNDRPLRPHFLRVRIVTLEDSSYMNCSCGLPSRMRLPCVHIFSVVDDMQPQMFHVRWWNDFQLHYGRGSKNLDTAFDKVLLQPYKGVCVDGLIPCFDGPFPNLLHGSTQEELSSMMKLYRCYQSKVPVVLGEEMIIDDDVGDDTSFDLDSSDMVDGFTIETHHTEEAAILIKRTQDIQDQEGAISTEGTAASRTELMKIISESYRLVEGSPSLQRYVVDMAVQFKINVVEEIQRRRQSKQRERDDSGKNENQLSKEVFSMGFTVNDNKRRCVRAKFAFER